jgi:hypothetical protein
MTAEQCGDANACTTDTCDAGVCHNTPVDNCTPCTTGEQCGDGNACTTDTCDAGVCHNTAIDGCKPCTTAGDCGDANACTTDTCDAGVCRNTAIEGCKPCTTAGDCGDANACTTDTCDEGVCHNTAIDGCKPCTTAGDCGDANACTTDTCDEGVCRNTAVEGCIPCAIAEDCGDDNACTVDTCNDGICGNDAIAGCIPCDTAADCNDEDVCTIEACEEGRCAFEPVVDCGGTPEICGDCVDNDNDGMIDYEDGDCCTEQRVMTIKKVFLKKPSAGPRGRKLRINSIFSQSTPAGFNPLQQDTSLQIADASGQLFCHTITADHWMSRRPRRYKFWDMQRMFAGGLSDGKFMVKKNGRIIFNTVGRKVRLRSVEGSMVRITVRVGGQCSTSTAALRTSKKALRFP